jgi:uracil-DNA glycosylase
MTTIPNTLPEYQKYCFINYKKDIGYPSHYSYLKGNPINVLVPIETTLNKVMIVGAYPSAKFYTVDSISDTPMSDNDSPFSNESYFDGSRVRTIPSGKELNEVILEKIGIKRSDCWITDLVKVFLFKKGHIKRYVDLGKKDLKENRSKFIEYAKKSMFYLEKEIEICNPKIIILLGLEVTKVFFSISDAKAKSYLDGNVKTKVINGIERNIICLPHPGILMKKTENNTWPKRFENEISKVAKEEIRKYLKHNL